MIFRLLFSALIVNILIGCSGTTVVLVPDAEGKVGQVDLITQAGSTHLSKANESAVASKADKPPSVAEELSETKIKDMFGKTLANEPTPPVRIVFHFRTGSSEILPEDNDNLGRAKTAIETRQSCDVSVIGHSDTVGSTAMNQGISMNRAKSVADALVNLGVAQKCMEDLRYYGENDPVVRTADNVDEPRNRRVEVEIR